MIFETTDSRKIEAWLWEHYSGEAYQFGILLDVPEEWAGPPKETYVYFLDTVAEEAAYYAGKKLCDGGCQEGART